MQRIKGYHAHVYYDATTMEQARELCEEAVRLFPVTMGRMHQKPVGPHPDWSCQLAFEPEFVGVVLPWLALYRKGLVVFMHPLTGDELADHGIMRSGWGLCGPWTCRFLVGRSQSPVMASSRARPLPQVVHSFQYLWGPCGSGRAREAGDAV